MFTRHFDFHGLWRWLFFGGIIGVTVGLFAVLFQFLLQGATQLCFESIIGLHLEGPINEQSVSQFPAAEAFSPWLLVLLPAIGGLITAIIVFKFAPEAQGHGTDAAIDAYHRRLGIIRPRVPIVKLISSVITLGTGGSGGREGPIAQIGAGIGSFLASRLKLDARTRRLLLVSGIAAGVGAIFRAPLAAAIFATEVLYSGIEMEVEALLPAMVASIVSYSVFASWFGFEPIFAQAASFEFNSALELLPYLALALVVGIGALFYVNSFYGITKMFSKISIPRYLKPAIGGLVTGATGLVLFLATKDTNALGVMSTGYGVLQSIISSDAAGMSITLLLLISFGKILTTSFTIGSGGSAGVFGPSMVIGGTLGAAVGLAFQQLMPALSVHPGAFMIVGMAGFFSAAANTPLSTLIMVSEMTGNYELLIPSMWVCTLAFLVCRRWTLYKSQVTSKLNSPAHLGDYAKEILSIATVSQVYKKTRKFVYVGADTKIGNILAEVGNTNQRIFPITDPAGKIIGCFRLSDLNLALQQPAEAVEKLCARDLILPDIRMAELGDSVQNALMMMMAQHADELPVIDNVRRDSIAGIVTRADILLYYSRQLSKMKISTGSSPGYPDMLEVEGMNK